MAQNQNEAISRYLEDAIAAERGVESQLQSMASDGDDDDVKGLLADGARLAHAQGERLAARFAESDVTVSVKTVTASALAGMQRVAQLGHIQEERTVQNLIAGYSMQMAGCGMYHALEAAARTAGDASTAEIAAHARAEKQALAAKLFHLIPTRSIIVYNMLTVAEVDPSVETKYRQASWSE